MDRGWRSSLQEPPAPSTHAWGEGPVEGEGLAGLCKLRLKASHIPSSHWMSLSSATALTLLVTRGEGAPCRPVETGETRALRDPPTYLGQDTMAANSISSAWPRGLSSQPPPLCPEGSSQGSPVTRSPLPPPLTVPMAAQTETEFDAFSYFLVPLGTWVTAILAPNAHWASTLWS